VIEVGRVCDIVRYPVKSMAGVATESAFLGWHGIGGDRRVAFRRPGDAGGFPWLTAGRLPELLLYAPMDFEESDGEVIPASVRTPAGAQLAVGSAELNAEISARFGSGVELMRLKHGIFDEAPVSIITLATMAGIGHEAGLTVDRRRFRPNLVLDTNGSDPFSEDDWVGSTLVFGDGDERPAVSVTLLDERCGMVNFDPETAAKDVRVMKTVVRLNNNRAGVYATVVRTGTIRVGDRVRVVQ
jgi:uncharacterized protein YcbX